MIDSGVDVCLLATPPGFRPTHLAACIDANKHVFCEKPISTDAPGVRWVLETSEKAKQKNLSLVAGFCWRYNNMIVDTSSRCTSGAIGRLVAYYATYYTNPVKPMPPASARPAGMSDTEWQIRNWYNFVWLCGDSMVEQAVHSADKIAWAMDDEPPVSCVGVGGAPFRPKAAISTIISRSTTSIRTVFVHFWPTVRSKAATTKTPTTSLAPTARCTIGRGPVPRIEGKTNWTWSGQKYDMYQREHDLLFASIRKNQPMNDGKRMATSTLLAMMGRMAAYTGQQVTWDQALNSQEKLFPETVDWNGSLPVAPRAEPGITKFV